MVHSTTWYYSLWVSDDFRDGGHHMGHHIAINEIIYIILIQILRALAFIIDL